jgi:hypothetical protein
VDDDYYVSWRGDEAVFNGLFPRRAHQISYSLFLSILAPAAIQHTHKGMAESED